MKAVLGLIVIFLLYNYYEISNHKIEVIKFKSEKINKNLKIVQISDFHSSRFIDQDKILKDIKKYGADLIFLTGDMLDGDNDNIGITIDFINRLKGLGKDIYFVIGNHEYRNINVEEFLKYIRKSGIKVLENQIESLEEYNIDIAGINFGLVKEEYKKLLDNLGDSKYNIVLSHSPKYPIEYHENKEDLIISGHTHGGQVRIPFIGAVVSPSEGFFPKYDKGIFKIGKSYLYIDSGLGTSALPIRVFCQSQISFIEIDRI